MAARLIDGKAISDARRAALTTRVAALAARGLQPCLAAITARPDAGWNVYQKNQASACAAVGIRYRNLELPDGATQADLAEAIETLNADDSVHGIILQAPLKRDGCDLDDFQAQAQLSPDKDVEGVSPTNLGLILAGRQALAPCTAVSAVELAKSAAGDLTLNGQPRTDLRGVEAVVVGASTIVGKPAAQLLLAAGATVTVCHIDTRDLAAHTTRADLVIVAVGKAGLIKPHLIKPGAVVVDVGINRVPGPDGKSRIVGDVDPAVADTAAALTPVPGGVGALTTTILLEATVDAAERLAVARPMLDGAALAKVLGVDLAPAVAERLARVVGRHLVSAAGGNARSPFERRLARGVLVLDGAMGSELIARGIPADRIAHATIDHPELVRDLHQAYLDAGAEVLTTNTFGVNRCRLNGDRELVVRLAHAGVRLARSVAAGRAFILGDLGPLGRVVGADLSSAEAEDIYAEAAAALAEAGADALLIETQPSTLEAAAALAGARRATRLPVLVSRTIAHDDPVELAEFARVCETGGAVAAGINCAAGPRALAPVVARLASLTALPVLARPNAGHPLRENGRIVYHLRPDYLVARMAEYLASGASLIGGCCGVGPAHIAALAKTYANAPLPRRTPGTPTDPATPGRPHGTTDVPSAPLPPEPHRPGTADVPSALLPQHPSTDSAARDPDPATGIGATSPHPLLAAAHAGRFPIIAMLPGRLPPAASAAALTRLAHAGAFAVGLLAGWPGAPRGPRLPARLAHLATATGKPAVLDLVAADTTLPAAQDTLLTAHLLGLRTVIIDAGVFSADTRADIPGGCDPVALVALVRRLNHGRDLAGTHLEEPTAFAIGVRLPADELVNTAAATRTAKPETLIAAGADFLTLQPIYDPAAFRTAMATLATCPVPIFAEILVLPDAATADELDNELPRLSIPDHLKRRLATDPGDDARGVQRFLHHWRHRLAGAVLMISDEKTTQAETIIARQTP